MDSPLKIKVKKLHPDAKLPKTLHLNDACADLHTIQDILIPNGRYISVPTGIAIEIPEGWEGQVRPRSGLAIKDGVSVLNTPGTIDAGYRGEVKVIMFNINIQKLDLFLRKGERIAQLAIRQVPEVKYEFVDKLSKTKRGEGGFGSTGK